ncbi:chitinase [Bacillus sp. M6-12]|uniref:glycosyl hydrolase family 18 protein n=1 Tax=Bacillus sp. M6-12 TaxID=2054166 RepID=UPI000C77C4DE|nr:glycosyl hydrolase family 18 protein [Bacillus sp. M6-12]PLS18241.1 chitinase [Bacillus sp. M6-12]
MRKIPILVGLFVFAAFCCGFLGGVLYSEQFKHPTKEAEPVYHSKKSPASKQKPEIKLSNKKVLIGYVQDFRDPASIDYSHMTHAIFSFAHPAKDGNLLLNGDLAMQNLRSTVEIAHKYNTKVILAVGGWYHIQGGESYEYFKTAIADPSSRMKLVNELMGIIEREKLDGADIDFEHPRSIEDARNLSLFTRALSERLHRQDRELSIAVYSKVHSVTGTEIKSVVFEPEMFQYVDHVNIMAYDGQYDAGYDAAYLSPYTFAANAVEYWSGLFESHKLPKQKLVLGVPVYAQPEEQSIKQVSFAAIIEKDPANEKLDTVSMNGTTYHYNGKVTIQKKTKLAMDHGFGGMMLWEAGHDARGANSITKTISEELANAEIDSRQQYYVKNK